MFVSPMIYLINVINMVPITYTINNNNILCLREKDRQKELKSKIFTAQCYYVIIYIRLM